MEQHKIIHSMGIPVHLTLVGVSKIEGEKLFQEAWKIFNEWDMRFSRFKEDSELNQLNMNSGKWQNASPKMIGVLKKCLDLARASEGLFDPSVGGHLAAAGYGLPKNFVLPNPAPTYQEIKIDENGGEIKTARGQILEPAGIVKGMAIDSASSVLKDVSAWMINAGGDILTHGEYPNQKFWNVAIQHPKNKRAIISVVKVKDSAIATSGIYETKWAHKNEQWHHQINIKTGRPTAGVQSVSVIAPTAELADTHASLAILYGLEKGLDYLNSQNVPYLVVDLGDRVYKNQPYADLETSL